MSSTLARSKPFSEKTRSAASKRRLLAWGSLGRGILNCEPLSAGSLTGRSILSDRPDRQAQIRRTSSGRLSVEPLQLSGKSAEIDRFVSGDLEPQTFRHGCGLLR